MTNVLENHPLKRVEKDEIPRSDLSSTQFKDINGAVYSNPLTRGFAGCFFGVPGSGKSYHLQRLVDDYVRHNTTYTEKKGWLSKTLVMDSPRVLTFDQNAQIKQVNGYRFQENPTGEKSEFPFQRFYNLKLLISNLEHGDIVILEEMNGITAGPDVKLLQELLGIRRHLGLIIVGTSQRPYNVPKAIVALSNYIFAFHTDLDVDVKFISSFSAEPVINILPNIEFGEDIGDKPRHVAIFRAPLPKDELIPKKAADRKEQPLIILPVMW